MPEKGKFYLAGPMSGYEEHNYPLFARVARHLRDVGYDVVSPHELAPLPDDGFNSEEVFRRLRMDARALSECTGIILLPGWSKSIGAKWELQIALGLRMQVLYWNQVGILQDFS